MTEPAFHLTNSLFEQLSHFFSPDGQRLGITLMLGRLLAEAG